LLIVLLFLAQFSPFQALMSAFFSGSAFLFLFFNLNSVLHLKLSHQVT